MQPRSEAVEGTNFKSAVSLIAQPKPTIIARLFSLGKTRKLFPDESLIDTFRLTERLLILGYPGLGKTTTLLKLADELLIEAKNPTNVAIPCFFDLSDWQYERQEIADWLIEQIRSDYDIDPKISKQWLQDGWIIPLLDGLDELGLLQQQDCVDKINAFVNERTNDNGISYQKLVVCCRSREYDESRILLNSLDGALELQPLNRQQIQQYCKNIDRLDLWKILSKQPTLRDWYQPLLRTASNVEEISFLSVPLFLKMLAYTYKKGENIIDKAGILNAYISEQLGCELDAALTKKRLCWLAIYLTKNNTPNGFLIEQMQPVYLPSEAKKQYRLLVMTVSVGVIFLLVTLLVSMNTGIRESLISSLVLTLLFSCIEVRNRRLNTITPVETFHMPTVNEGNTVDLSDLSDSTLQPLITGPIVGAKWGAMVGFILGLVGAIVIICIDGLTMRDSIASLVDGLTTGVILGIVIGMIFGALRFFGGLMEFFRADLEIRETPNQGIFLSARNFLFVTFLAFIYHFILISIGFYFNRGSEGIEILFVLMVHFGFYRGGGLPAVQHGVLRWILYRQGDIPWNYSKFLKYTTERRLTQQIGGRFRFIHRELLDHFAAMNVEQLKAH